MSPPRKSALATVLACAIGVGACNAVLGLEERKAANRQESASSGGGHGGAPVGVGGEGGSPVLQAGGFGGRASGGGGGSAGDGGIGGEPVVVPSCADQYGMIPNSFTQCSESMTDCTLWVDLDGQSCQQICRGHGGECVLAYADGNGQCQMDEANSCTEGYSDNHCVCTRGCGGGLPCVAPQVCVGTACM